jgi:multisubunit Na+/H+ antiporter MnhE subunit
MDEIEKGQAPKRTRFRSILGLAGGIIGLIAGFVVLNLGGDDLSAGEKALRIVFGIVWFTFFVGMMIANSLNLAAVSRAKKREKTRLP